MFALRRAQASFSGPFLLTLLALVSSQKGNHSPTRICSPKQRPLHDCLRTFSARFLFFFFHLPASVTLFLSLCTTLFHILLEPIARNQLVLTHGSSLSTKHVALGKQMRGELLVASTSGVSFPSMI